MSAVRLPAQERREQLLRVARQELARRGFHETSMNDIAEAAGVTKPVLYQHFSSKRELYGAVLEDVGHRLQAAVFESAAKATSPREMVEAGFTAYVEFVAQDYDGFSLLFSRTGREDQEWDQLANEIESSVASRIAELIDVDGMDQHHREVLAHGVVGMAEGMARHWRGRQDEIRNDDLIRDLTTLAWVGLRGLEAT